jgi:hypothetical protein
MAANNYIDLPVEGGGTGVTSLNGETGAINIVAGTGISVTPAGQDITIAATGGGGDVVGPGSSVDGQVALFNGTTGKIIKADTDTGVAHLTAGVLTASNVNLASEVTGTLPVTNGGTGQSSYTNGQILIGNTTGNTLVKTTLTAGTGISVTNGAGSITLATTGAPPTGAAGGDLGGTYPNPTVVSVADVTTGVLSPPNGGTGQSTYTDGQLLIGSTAGNTLAKSTLTAGTGIAITNGTGSISIATTGAPPTGSAGGDLSGTYPNPNVVSVAHVTTGTLGIANGGTSQTTAANARGPSGLNIDERSTFSNVDYTALNTDRYIGQIGTMSAPRTVTLPSASTLNAGQLMFIIDESGTVSTTNTISVTASGGQTIDGAASRTIRSAFGYIRLYSTGSNWSSGVERIGGGGTGLSTIPTSGQLLIGNSTTSAYSLSTLTAGTGITITNGAGTITLASQGSTTRSTVTGATYTVVAGDRGNLVEFTDSVNTVFTITAPGTLGAGFYCYLKNGGAAGFTMQLVPASGNIDGVASFYIYPGDTRLLICDGSNFFTELLEGGYVEFTAAGANTFQVPKNINWVTAQIWGAGGGGGSGKRGPAAQARTGGTGGGGGAMNFATFRPSDLGTSVTVTIATGGTGAGVNTSDGTSGSNGNPGGNTTFGSLLTAFGGGAGAGCTIASFSGGSGGGALSAGVLGINSTNSTGGSPSGASGQAGQGLGGGGSLQGGVGAAAAWGGAGGGGTTGGGAGFAGGSAMYGGSGGGSAGGLTTGNATTASGAGGSSTGATGGGGSAGAAGTSGVVGQKGGDGTAGPTSLGPGTAGGGGGCGFDNTGGGTASAAGSGGNGGIACGGGGGGGSLNGNNGGGGGNGGNGYCRIWYG